jgi:hypothetical protein
MYVCICIYVSTYICARLIEQQRVCCMYICRLILFSSVTGTYMCTYCSRRLILQEMEQLKNVAALDLDFPGANPTTFLMH